MKILALNIGGTPVQLPGEINTVNNRAGTFGIHIFQLAIDLFIFAGALLTLFYMIYGGVKWMTSQGDKKAVEEARTIITYSVVGMIIIAMGFLIVSVLGAFFNVPLIHK